MADPVAWFEVVGGDGPALQRFYADIFGWKLDDSSGMGYAIVEAADGGIAGGIGGSQTGEGHATFYVRVESPKACLDRIEAAGGETVVPETEIPNMVTFAMFRDPVGNLVGLFKG